MTVSVSGAARRHGPGARPAARCVMKCRSCRPHHRERLGYSRLGIRSKEIAQCIEPEPPCAVRGGARFARMACAWCAKRSLGAGRTCPVCFKDVLSRRRERKAKRPAHMPRLPPSLHRLFQGQSRFRTIISDFMNKPAERLAGGRNSSFRRPARPPPFALRQRRRGFRATPPSVSSGVLRKALARKRPPAGVDPRLPDAGLRGQPFQPNLPVCTPKRTSSVKAFDSRPNETVILSV